VMARRLQVPIWIYDVDNNRVLHANQSACDLWQAKSEAELQERNFGADMSPTVLNRLKQYQAAFLERDAEFTEQWTLYPNGTPKSVLIIPSSRPHGHAAGDTVLQHIARQCRAIIGVDDLVARIGGDEFVIIMSGTRKRAALDARIADLRLAISRPILHNQTLVGSTSRRTRSSVRKG